MDLTLKRTDFREDGIFGFIEEFNIFTLEHAYLENGVYKPKVPVGTYTCQMGMHSLGSGRRLITYELLNVPGHSGILIHPGNKNSDSEGCILVGEDISKGEVWTIERSVEAFLSLKKKQGGLPDFKITIEE